MFVKMMEYSNLRDGDSSKRFRLVECKAVKFWSEDGVPAATTTGEHGEKTRHLLDGNAYILNRNGHTIDKWLILPEQA